MDNDYQMEKLLNELKEFKEEKERLINLTLKVIEDYQNNINFYNSQIEDKTKYTSDVIHSLIDITKMKKTKTQKSHQLLSGKIIIPEDKYNMKLKADYNEKEIPEEFIKIKKSIAWGEYKKQLKVINDKVINKETGEIVDNVEIEKVKGGQIKIKLE